MAADDPKDAKKEFNRVKDNAGLEHNKKDVPRQDRAPRGHSGTQHSLAPAGPGGMSQTPRREFKRRDDKPEQSRDEKNRDTARSPEKKDAPQKGDKQFEKRELSREFKERSR
jgi:hypothetical protein